MYSIISIVLLITAINCISFGIEWFKVLIFASVGFAIAGAIGSVSSRIDDIFSRTNIKKKDLIDGTTQIIIRKEPYSNDKK